MSWPEESISDDAALFLRVHVNLLISTKGRLHPGIFREQGGSMSVDWAKYSTAEESLARATDPTKNGIMRLIAGPVREIRTLGVRHSPDAPRNNQAHSDVTGIAGSPELDETAKRIHVTRVRAELFARFGQWHLTPPGFE